MIRAAVPADAAAIAAIYAPYVADTTISFEIRPPDAAVIGARMAASGGRLPWLVATDADGAVTGYAYAGAFSERAAYDPTVETAIYCAPAAHRSGTGRALYAALLDDCARRGLAQAIGRISLPNDPSIALHAALGFVRAGRLVGVGWKLGRWIDVELWQRALDPIR